MAARERPLQAWLPMIRLAYSTSGLTQLPFPEAIDAVSRAGYPGIELSFHRERFNPFELSGDDLAGIRRRLDDAGIVAPCVATASHFFNPQQPHEPSLMTLDLAGRKRRIELVKRGIRVARRLGVGLVTFGSGFRRPEHVRDPSVDPRELLVDSIRECLREIHDGEDITLLIEPEPGMLVETLDQGLELIDAVGSSHFALHVDICHAYCSEADYIGALARAAPHARYLHVSDACRGYNLKIVEDADGLAFDMQLASWLVYFPATAGFLLIDPRHPLYFGDIAPAPAQRVRIDTLLARAGVATPPRMVGYQGLGAGRSPLDDEIFTWLISQPALSHEVLMRAWPIAAYLRGARGPALVERMLANTLTGMVHFHEVPGRGSIDLAASFKALDDHGFDGFGAVELYHHVDAWREALEASHRHLSAIARA